MAKNAEEFENELIQEFVTVFNGLSTDKAVRLHNIWCENTSHYDDIIYPNDDETIDEHLQGKTPSDILRMSFYGRYNSSHDYFWYNGYANLVSGDFTNEIDIINDGETYANYFFENPDEIEEIDDFEEFCDKVNEGFEDEDDEEEEDEE